jgi:subtilisin family serine protease
VGRFTAHSSKAVAFAGFTFLFLTSCAESTGKTFKPVVAKVGAEVVALSAEDAKTVCADHYCEDNQVYVTHFGRRKSQPAPPPPPMPQKQPIPQPTGPGDVPPQPAEQLDYSRSVMNLSDAWAVTEGSTSVTVAVIDSGTDYFHPDLASNIAVNSAEKNGVAGVDDDGNGYVDDVYGWDFYNDRPNGYDDNGHGTHVSGTIAAAHNGIGVRGVAPRVKILPVKFLGADGSGDTADAIRAIDYAVARGAKILSNSWGGGAYSKLLDDAVQRAINHGVVFVAAAGNSSMNNDSSPNYPAGYAGVVSVGSSDEYDQRSSFSNYGATSVYVFAPGSTILSTYPNGQYRVMSGTSMATPQVSGALALAFSAKPGLTRSQALSDLCASSIDRLTDVSKCGRIDVGAFVRRAAAR